MAYDYGMDPMGNYTGYADQEADILAQQEEERKRKEAEAERQRKEAERLAKERDNLAVHKQEVTTYANGSKTITNVAEIPATSNAPGRPVAPSGFQGQTDEFGGVDQAIAKQEEMRKADEARAQQEAQLRAQAQRDQAAGNQRMGQQNVAVPVNPNDVFQRQIQAESGGNHIDPRTGQVITSNKGALGIAQVMPRTAMQPGYGVPDIFTLAQQQGVPFSDRSEASAKQLLANSNLNMQFGQNYKNAMLQQFGGDEEKATASYNAGVGGVNKAVQRAQQMGGDWKDHLPNETKGYLQKVFGGQQQPQQVIRGPVSPEAGAGRGFVNPQAVNAPVAPDDSIINNQVADYERRQAEAQGAPAGEGAPAPQGPVSPYSLATGQGAPGIKVPGMKPTGVANSEASINAYQESQNDPMALMKLGTSDDPNVPDWIKDRARNRAADLVSETREMNKAKEIVANASETDLAKYLRKKTEGGSYLKLFMYNMLGMDKSAAEESAKLGKGDEKLASTSDGKPALIKYSSNGTPIEGYDATTGKKLTAEQLVGSSARVATASAMKTAQTQATHAYTQAYTSLMKQRDEMIRARATPEDLKAAGLDEVSIKTRASQAGQDVMTAAKSNYGIGGGGGEDLSRTTPTAATTGATPTAMPTGATTETAKTETAKTAPAEYADSKILSNWDKFRAGEDAKTKVKRTSIDPAEIDAAARALVEGRVKPTEFTGRQNDFRKYAVERALELDPKYTPMRYDTVKDVVKRYTSGKDHDTLVNTGTAVNHLLQFKDIASQTPGNTDVSSWNTFYQNLMKYGDAPEIKSKEQMAGFVAGELVKAASGAQGSMTERIHQEQLLMKANTPAEVQKVIDNAIRLAHGRYDSMRSSFSGSTGRSKQEFNDLIGMPEEARVAFDKIDAQHTIKAQGSAAEKWAREHPEDPRSKEILKRLGK